MNTLVLKRFTHSDNPTLGGLFHLGKLVCFTVEDRKRIGPKVPGDTRIPEGAYPLRWRSWGSWAKRFAKLGYPGALEVMDVPDFTDILFHWGNTKANTEGCILPNRKLDSEVFAGESSKRATAKLYRLVRDTGGEWEISIV